MTQFCASQGSPAGSIRPDPAALDSTAFRRPRVSVTLQQVDFPAGPQMGLSENRVYSQL